MKLEWDETKRLTTLKERGLDFASAVELFGGIHVIIPDEREDYGEKRFFAAGFIAQRICVVVWTPRGDARRIISMRKANDREKERYGVFLDRSG